MNAKDEEYLLERMNASFQCEWHEVTPEFMRDPEKRRQERQKQKGNIKKKRIDFLIID